MTNREWLLNKIQNMSDEELAKIIREDKACICSKEQREKCYGKSCLECKTEWLKSEHKEKITLSEAERVILENIDKDYKWIARDEERYLRCYDCKPVKGKDFWNITGNKYLHMGGFNHLFQFITWENSEPYNIEELLKGE